MDDIDDHRPQELTDQQRVGVALMGDSSFSDLIEKLLLHFGPDIGGGAVRARMILEEILDELADGGYLTGHSPTAMDSVKGQVAIIKMLEFIYKRHRTPAMFAALYVMDLPLLDDITGHLNQNQYAARIGVTKAAVNKAVQEAQKFFNRPPRSDQRSKASCQKMKEARVGQLLNEIKDAETLEEAIEKLNARLE
jgi:hypothetical protein